MAKRNVHRTAKELLSWFDFNKYNRLRELTIVEFFIQVAVRRDLKIKIDRWRDESPHPDIQNFFPSIQKDPVISAEELEQPPFGLHLFPSLHHLATGKYNHGLGVRPVSIEEYYLHEIWTREPELSRSRRFFESVAQPGAGSTAALSEAQRAERIRLQFNSRLFDAYHGDATEPSYQAWMSEPLYRHQHGTDGTVFLAVNVDLPLTVLRKQFEECVQDAQAFVLSTSEMNSRERGFDFEFMRDEWMEARVFQYLDLLLWSHLNRKLTNAEIAAVIYPQGEGGEETVRNTAKVRALELVEIGSIPYRLLWSQVAEELKKCTAIQ